MLGTAGLVLTQRAGYKLNLAGNLGSMPDGMTELTGGGGTVASSAPSTQYNEVGEITSYDMCLDQMESERYCAHSCAPGHVALRFAYPTADACVQAVATYDTDVLEEARRSYVVCKDQEDQYRCALAECPEGDLQLSGTYPIERECLDRVAMIYANQTASIPARPPLNFTLTVSNNTSVFNNDGTKIGDLGTIAGPGGIDCTGYQTSDNAQGVCEASVLEGTNVSLTATPKSNRTFVLWDPGSASTRTCPCAQNQSACSFVMSDNVECIAWYRSTTESQVKVSADANGTVKATIGTLERECSSATSCDLLAQNGATVHLTAQPSSGRIFSGWYGFTGHCPCPERSVECSFTLSSDAYCIGLFR